MMVLIGGFVLALLGYAFWRSREPAIAVGDTGAYWTANRAAEGLLPERVAQIRSRHDFAARDVIRWLDYARDAGRAFGLDPYVLLGIMSIESAGDPEALGDNGHAWGLMQINDIAHPTRVAQWKREGESPFGNIDLGAAILAEARATLRKAGYTGPALERAAIAAYNRGAGAILANRKAGRDPDYGTAGGDYSRNVLLRAAWFREQS